MWYVISYNSIRGHISGSFQDLHGVFLGPDIGTDYINWVPLLSQAQAFPSQEKAQEQIDQRWWKATWLGVAYFREVDLEVDDWAESCRQNREGMSRRLASRQISREELIDQLSNYENVTENRFTPRENWIFNVLMENKES